MGFWDIFRRKDKVKSLPEGINKKSIKENKESKENRDKIKIFAQRFGDNTEYVIKLVSNKGNVNIGVMYARTDIENQREDRSFREIVNEIDELLDEMKKAKNNEELNIAKYNLKEKLGNLSTKNIRFIVDRDMGNYIEEYAIDEDSKEEIEYERIDKLVGADKEIVHSEITKMEKKLLDRLDVLESIKSPEDAYKQKDSLIKYMKEKEEVPRNPIIDANIKSIENGENLEETTVLKIAREMEQIKNEDGALYSAYLKLEEKRILKQIYNVITTYNLSRPYEDMSKIRETNKAIRHIKGQIDTTKGGLSTEILDYIIKTIREENIETYTENYKEADYRLYNHVENKLDLKGKDKEEIMNFLSARMICLGQVNYEISKTKRGGKSTLRDFVENTDFKDEDNQESKNFLYIIAQIEKKQIKSQYIPVVEKYSRSHEEKTQDTKKTSFKNSLYYDVESETPVKTSNKIKNKELESEKEM